MPSRKRCQIPVLGIIDIDGSLVRYVYGDKELVANDELLDETLTNLPPFPWVLESGILSRMTKYTVITGRQTRQRDLTLKWFDEKLDISDPELIMVAYKNKDQYLADKEAYIEQAIRNWWETYPNGSKIIVVDDDPHILEYLRETWTHPDIQIVSVDENGIPHFS